MRVCRQRANPANICFLNILFIVKRVKKDQVDLAGNVGLDIAGWYAKDAIDEAIEYYVWDWEMGESPELSSTIFTVVNDQWTYGETSFGPGSDGDNFVIDPRYVTLQRLAFF